MRLMMKETLRSTWRQDITTMQLWSRLYYMQNQIVGFKTVKGKQRYIGWSSEIDGVRKIDSETVSGSG